MCAESVYQEENESFWDQIEGKIQPQRDVFPVHIGWKTRVCGARVDPIGPRGVAVLVPTKPSNSKSTMQSILARSSLRRLPPPTLPLRAFSSSAATRQAVPTETRPLNKEFKIYRWVLSSLLLSTFPPTPRSPLSFCRIQMNLRKSLNCNPTLLI